MAAMKRGKYRVVFERDGSGAWIARAPSVRGEGADTPERAEDVRLPARVRDAIGRTRSARRHAQREREKAQQALMRVARTLVDEVGLSLRDAGELLDLSHQRVQQLTGERTPTARARSRAPRP